MVMVNFLSKKISIGILNEDISFAETDFTSREMSISTNEIAAFRFKWKIFLKRKLTIILLSYTDKLHLRFVI